MKYALRRDPNEPQIIDALEDAGVEVHRLHVPADLLVRRHSWAPGWFMLLEVTHPARGGREQKQVEFLNRCKVPLVTNAQDALIAIGAIGGL